MTRSEKSVHDLLEMQQIARIALNIHVDTSFPCSLQEAGQGCEGGWSLDFNNESNGCHRADDAEYYAMNFSSQHMHPQVQDVGWWC